MKSIDRDSHKDDFKHKGLRRRMIAEVREKLPFVSSAVLDAMENVPRHLFIGDSAFLSYAYKANSAFKIAGEQTISRPTTVATQTELLQLTKTDVVLEIGTGSGYQTAVLCELAAKVFSIERQKILFDKTRDLLRNLGYKPTLFYGDGFKGLKAFAPFDKIIVTCGAPFIPEDLKNQLKIGGIMVIPVGEGETQEMQILIKVTETEFIVENFGTFAFVPMLGDRQAL
ncbi:MAG: protein-L-isoaspartate(D-aspartate) O-methyltransferase [Luteibaculaceae bacterium]